MKRAVLILVGAMAVGCAGDPRESSTTFGTAASTAASASTTGDSLTTGVGSSGSTSGESSESTSSDSASESTGADSSSGTSTDPSSGSSSGPEADCGNRIIEGDEECDDGNASDRDDCTTTCVLTACDDGALNGFESDVDCGGTCSPCALCSTCLAAADCDSGLCNTEGLCGFEDQMVMDSRLNCSSQPSPNVASARIQNLPAGTYLATAVDSAWNAYDEANPPDTGWTYFTPCSGMDLQQMRTPEGLRYVDPATAFAAIMSPSETFTFGGGDLACSRVDTNCGDNQGSVIFDIALVCDAA